MENSMEVPQITKNRVAIWASNLTPRHIPRWHYNFKRCIHPYVHSSTIHNSQTWKQPKCPLTDEWIKKMWYKYTMEYYSAIKMNEMMPFTATWTNLDIIILSEVRKRQIPYGITYIWNLKYDTSELTYKTETDLETRHVVAKGEE